MTAFCPTERKLQLHQSSDPPFLEHGEVNAFHRNARHAIEHTGKHKRLVTRDKDTALTPRHRPHGPSRQIVHVRRVLKAFTIFLVKEDICSRICFASHAFRSRLAGFEEWRKGCKLKFADWRMDDRERRVEFRQQHDMQRRLQLADICRDGEELWPGTVRRYAYVGPTSYVRTSETAGRGALQC